LGEWEKDKRREAAVINWIGTRWIRIHWIGFVAARYVSRGRRNSPSPVLSVLGIATGVLALTVIIAVMNGFQLGFIESILEISSYHLRLEDLPPEDGDEFSAKLRSLPEVFSVLPFRELNVLLRGRQINPRGALVRGVPSDAFDLDKGLARHLEIEEGFFDLDDPYNIVLGAELARQLSVRTGDQVSLLSITDGIRFEEEGGNDIYKVSGIFRSGFYEYDLGWAFVDLDRAAQLSGYPAGEPTVPVLGIKLKNRWQDQKAASEVEKLLADSKALGTSITSWRDFNRAFFGALRTEKLIMFVLVGLIFVVVGLNIFQAQRRIVLERREEIGLLRALGASDTAVRLVFVCDGIIIGLTGAGLGLIAGLLIAFNIPAVFSFLEGTVNLFISMLNALSDLVGANAGAGEFALFSPQIFYIKEIPSRVIPHEVVLIFLFGFLSALSAAWFASGKVAGIKPAEVLRYE
jgi:lipoprotein-releasing system permease protein